MEPNYSDVTKVFRALSDVKRLQILELLHDNEKCACKILDHLNIGQSTLSHHMKILCDSGIVENHCEGKWTHYSISKKGCRNAKKILEEITCQTLPKSEV